MQRTQGGPRSCTCRSLNLHVLAEEECSMRKMAHPMQLLFLVLAVLACVAVDRTATALESSVLRLEVTANPYSYQIIEKATGLVLVSQSETRFTVGGTTRTATGAAGIGETSTNLDATLSLSGTTDTAHVQFTFASPEVLQVLLTYDNGTPTAIRGTPAAKRSRDAEAMQKRPYWSIMPYAKPNQM